MTIPTFTADLKRLNEAAVAHDIALGVEHGFTLHAARHRDEHHAGGERADDGDRARGGGRRACASSSTRPSARSRTTSRRSGSPSARARTSRCCPIRRSSGRRPSRRSTTTRRPFCDATSLGVMLFALPAWGFERIHPAGMSVEFVRRVLDTIPEHRRRQVRAGLPARRRRLRDVPPLPRRGRHQLPHRGGRAAAHGRHGHAVLRHEQHRVDERLVPRDLRAGPDGPLAGGDGALLGGAAGAAGQRGRHRRRTSPARTS